MIDVDKLLKGDRRTLSKAITLIESSRAEDQVAAQALLTRILPHTGKSFRLGITGSPGVGKSTFIEHFGVHLLQKNYKVAVLAIDPSSPTSGGSILGDKTRMEKLSNESNAFIRPTPTSGTLGGVAQKTRETILLCEAAGYDFIIIETVGVGQSEYEVASMVDFFMLLILPSGGDELQGIKKGILELAQSVIINKADGESVDAAKRTQVQYSSALQITASSNFWKTEVLTNSSVSNTDFDKILNLLLNYQKLAHQNLYWDKRRKDQNFDWYNSLIKELVLQKIHDDKKISAEFDKLSVEVQNLKITPIEAAKAIVKEMFSKK